MGFFDSWKVGIRTNMRHQVYYPGNVVEGFVELTVSSPIDMVAVRVKATGKEKVFCRRQRQVGMNDDGSPIYETETIVESNCVYKQLITLAGNMKCTGMRNSLMVPAGRFTYPFAFQLPVAIPPSFSKRAGDDEADIIYHIKAYVDIPFGRDACHRQWFTVLKPMPKSQWISRAPVTVDRNWNITMCCCIDKGTVAGRLFMDRTVIAIDRDNLVVCADIDNTNGKEPVKALEINLMNALVYKAGWVTERNVVCAGQNFINNEIPAGAKGRIAGTIPLPRGLVPSLCTWNVTSEYYIDMELNIPWASDPKHMFPVVLAQSVDETDFSPPVTWGSNPYTLVGKQQYQEFYYQPPPNPCYQLNPIPCQPPAGANLWNMQFNVQMPMPRQAGWAAPTMYKQNCPNMAPVEIAWETGVVQAEVAAVQAATLDLALGAGGYGQEITYGAAGGDVSVSATVTLSDDPNQPLLA